MKTIKLSRDMLAKVDDADYDFLSQWKWSYSTNGYAVRTEWPSRRVVYMHRFIMQTPDKMHTDHKNEDKLDNQRSNLRTCTPSENNLNRGRIRSQSGFKGVTWSKQHSKWKAQLGVTRDGIRKNVYLGEFADVRDAAEAYLIGARKHYGTEVLLGKEIA